MVISGWFKEGMSAHVLVEWRYAQEGSGELFVMMPGIIEMLKWSAGNWDIQPMVDYM